MARLTGRQPANRATAHRPNSAAAKERKTAWLNLWHNASLKNSFMAYMVIYLLIALGGALLSSAFFVQKQADLAAPEVVRLYLYDPQAIEQAPERGADSAPAPAAEVAAQTEAALLGETATSAETAAGTTTATTESEEDAPSADAPVSYRLEDEHPARSIAAKVACIALAFLMFPLWFGTCIWAASRRFYAQRLKPALTVLDDAAAKISEQDLDFTVTYPRNDEMGHLASSFETMRASLAQSQHDLWHASEERKRLNAAFAHDLRTPLTVLRGRIELLQARAASGSIDPTRLAADADALIQQVDRLERYVEAMGNLQRLDDRLVTRSTTSLGELARNIQLAGETLCALTGTSFSLATHEAPNSLVHVDRALVLEVSENLIANAARHATGSVTATLALENASSSGSATHTALRISVEDDGPGFSHNALRHGCSPFFSESKESGNFGLGLNIASLLCEKHGGTLVLANRPQGGARVTATFAC